MMMVKNWHKAVVVMLLMAVMLMAYAGFAPKREAAAQGSNILLNPSFGETWYGATGVDGQIPTSWNLWASGQKPATDRYVDSAFTRTPPAWIMKGGFVQWTAGGYQSVAVENGATYRFSIYALVYVCNDLATSCIGNGVPRTSQQAIGSKVKVGIDPTGGTDPASGNIVWSGLTSPYDKFAEVAVEAQARAGTITVFTFNSVDSVPNLRETVWDDASLVKTTAATTGTPGATVAPPPPAGVPFVSPQAARPDGSVVHTVTEGDTFSSILVAYRSLGVTRDMILAANGWDLPPQIIVPGQEIIILPPGSVNPTTGQVISLPGGGSVAPAPTAGSVPPAATQAVAPTQAAPGQVETVNPPAAPPAGGPSSVRPADTDAEKGG
ncbi:MAG: LysM peptidoglycan-binding domain-containing protein [Chloroflexi bacterium]|nr:LysM peptidoglycan-binding domain-containing protein [Chloroflexota bacterium]